LHNGFTRLSGDASQTATDEEEPLEKADDDEAGFEYLLDMPARIFSTEKASQLEKQLNRLEEELRKLEATSAEDMWLEDLQQFTDAYEKALEKEPKIPNATLSKSDIRSAKLQFDKDRKKSQRSTQQVEQAADDPRWMKSKTKADLWELCEQRGIAVRKTGTKQDYVSSLLLYGSMAYSSDDFAKMTVDVLTAHLRARGLSEDGRKEDMMQRLQQDQQTANPLDKLKFQEAAIKKRLKERKVRVGPEASHSLLEKCWRLILSQDAQEEQYLKGTVKDDLLKIAKQKRIKVEGLTGKEMMQKIARWNVDQSLPDECKALA